ncbi:hypothetical protein ACIBG8_08875 [Nonomuraea sp. NPDC050556]|uniref:hypothetical protein n=1 Tax=Nonomuraea sp. NPDC050556 TaxID=3364369 RepID=UPI0037BBE3C9
MLVGLTMAAFGLAPRLSGVGWAALVGFVLLGELGRLLRLDAWLLNLSPFAHVPKLPGAPLAALTVLAALLIAAGLAGLRRRDV